MWTFDYTKQRIVGIVAKKQSSNNTEYSGLETYRCSDLVRMRSIALSNEINAHYAAQLTNDKFLISCMNKNARFRIRISYFRYSSPIPSVQTTDLYPDCEDTHLFIVDSFTGKVFL